jgi:hypothetical protein
VKIVKEGRKYLGEGEAFNLEDFMQNFCRDRSSTRNSDPTKNKNKNKNKNKKKENLTLADIPKVDSSKPRVKTFIKDSEDD